jgi:tetratricopeptide (TPR) repeat protein
LRKIDGEWKIKDPSQSPLPDDIRALLVSRIDRLTEDVKDVVLSAAVLGREFELQILSFMLDGDARLAVKVADAEQNAIWSKMGELRYLFTNALLLDAAYRMQIHSRRQVLHKSAVTAIENLYSGELSAYSTDLAYHCEKAGLAEKARAYLIDAADAAKKEYRNSQAIDFLSRALNLTAHEDFYPKFDLLLSREELYGLLGQRQDQLKDLENLKNLLNTAEGFISIQEINVYRSKNAIEWANYHNEIGDYKQGIEFAKEIISIAEITNDPEDLIEAYSIWAISLYHQGYFDDAEMKAFTGLTQANSAGDLEGEIQLLNLLGLIALGTDNVDKAQRYFTQSLRMAEDTGNLRDQARALNNLGNLTLSGGKFDSAKDYYLRSLTFVRKIGDLPREGLVLNNLGYIAGVQGDYLDAKEYYDQSLRNTRQIGNKIQEAYTSINSSSIYRNINEFSKALSLAELGLSITREIGDRNWEAWALTSLGNTNYELGNLDEATQSYEFAVDLRRSMKQQNLANEPLAGLARIDLQNNNPTEALTYVEQILEHLENGGTLEGTDEPIRIYLTCYQVLRKVDDPRYKNILEEGHNLLRSRGSGIKNDAVRKDFYEKIPHNKKLISEWNSIQE